MQCTYVIIAKICPTIVMGVWIAAFWHSLVGLEFHI
uniref:Uncharacterized protein n=1 Tax=Rhizophora mucronata TaxID=61149 RepID=A0A2P2IHP0_RHIMU